MENQKVFQGYIDWIMESLFNMDSFYIFFRAQLFVIDIIANIKTFVE